MAKTDKAPATTQDAKQATAAAGPKCPLTADEFMGAAKPILVEINGEKKVAAPKQFASGSFGWFFNEKVTIMVGDVPVKVQGNLILTAVGSAPKK
jgi:hypothetical protein